MTHPPLHSPFRRFWMICRMPTGPGSKSEPRVRYPSLTDARAAARDMADQHGHPFVVLEAAEVVAPKDTSTKSLF